MVFQTLKAIKATLMPKSRPKSKLFPSRSTAVQSSWRLRNLLMWNASAKWLTKCKAVHSLLASAERKLPKLSSSTRIWLRNAKSVERLEHTKSRPQKNKRIFLRLLLMPFQELQTPTVLIMRRHLCMWLRLTAARVLQEAAPWLPQCRDQMERSLLFTNSLVVMPRCSFS